MVVYKITNKINDKIYIGQTTRSLKDRWRNHLSQYSGCVAIKNAIDKYGADNFIIEVISECTTVNDLNKT